MELWIRSQDKKVLRRVYSLGIYERNNKWHIAENLMMDFGVYKTEKRALEILNEIQSVLFLKDTYKYDRELLLKSWENVDEEQVKIIRQQISVYEMPEE